VLWTPPLSASEEEKAKVTVGTASLLDYLGHALNEKDEMVFTFCLGTDAFLDLTAGKWNESARVLQYFCGSKLVVLHRKGVDAASSAPGNKNDERLLESRIRQTGARMIHIGALGSISSSQVRQCRDPEQLTALVGPRVSEYIQNNRLYQFALLDKTSGTSSGAGKS
jgi:nicotinic acid mononucleotide adenylyltransferase